MNIFMVLCSVAYFISVSIFFDNFRSTGHHDRVMIAFSIQIFLVAMIFCEIIRRVRVFSRLKKMNFVMGKVIEISSSNTFGVEKFNIKYIYNIGNVDYIGDRYDILNRYVPLSKLQMDEHIPSFNNPYELEGSLIRIYFDEDEVWSSVLNNREHHNLRNMIAPSLAVILICVIELFL